jgi:hypothetical protein
VPNELVKKKSLYYSIMVASQNAFRSKSIEMELDVRDAIMRFNEETASRTNETTYDDQFIDWEMPHVNICIPYILCDIKGTGDTIDEISPEDTLPVYAWFRCAGTSSVGIQTLPGPRLGTTTLRFHILDATSREELLEALIRPYFMGSLHERISSTFS